jgi:opacity protein-like surface antigen
MKKYVLLVMCAALALAASSAFAQCPQVIIGDAEDGTIDGVYHQNWDRVLSADTCYVLQGMYYVDSTYTLTIGAGTTILGDTATAAAYGGTLVIKRGGTIYAFGEQDRPIVMTSRRAPGERKSGDWGGVVLCGRAPINQVEPPIEGGFVEGSYGGDHPMDSSGVLRYTRIEFAGYRFQLNNEINGLTLCGVGKGTELSHIQVSYADDDQYEFFGGTVWADHLVSFGATDDEYDSDFGFSGKMQFLFGLKDYNQFDPTGESRGFESDGSGSAVCITPYTEGVACNVTLVGPARTDSLLTDPDFINVMGSATFDWSSVVRRCSHFSVLNSAILGFPRGLSMRDHGSPSQCDVCTHQAACDEELQWRAISLAAFATGHDDTRWPAGDVCRCPQGVTAWFATPAYQNVGVIRNPDTIGLTDMSDLNNPNPVPLPTSELTTSPVEPFSNPKLAGLTPTTYRGAFDPALPMSQQWTAGWTNFDPQNTIYCSSCTATGIEDGQPVKPVNLLGQNKPNPFNPSTVIPFMVPEAGRVTLKVYNVAGEVVATLIDKNMTAGEYTTNFNPTNLSSGVYFYRLTGNGFTEMKKMVLLK